MSSQFFLDVEAKLNLLEEQIDRLKDQHIHNLYIQSPIPTLITNETGVIIEYNSAMTELTGYSHDEMPDFKTWLFNIYPDKDYRTTVSKIIKKTGKRSLDAKREEFIITTKTGDQRHIEFFIFNIGNNGKSTEFQGIQCLDISERKRSEKLLQIQRDIGIAMSASIDMKKALDILLENTLRLGEIDCGGIYLIDNDTQTVNLFTYMNFSEEYIKQVSHYSLDSPQVKLLLPGKPIYKHSDELYEEMSELFHQEGLCTMGVIPILYQNELVASLNVASRTKNEISHNTRTALESIAARTGGIITRIKTGEALQKSRDELEQRVEERIAELDSYKKQVNQAERLAATGRLAASIAHEINNPLQVIYAHIGFIEKLVPGDFKVNNSAVQIKNAMNRIKNVVKRLLDIHRTQHPEKTKVNIHESIESALDLLENQLLINNVEVKKHFWSEHIYINSIVQDLHQIFINLFINAQDAMPEGGILEIATSIENNKLCIQIKDTGCGIPPEIINLIFDPYFTTKTTMLGTGLGLSTTKGIIESHGGTITVESQVRKGSTFTITFPLSL